MRVEVVDMSDDDGAGADQWRDLTRQMCEQPCAIPALLSLLAAGGSAAFSALVLEHPRMALSAGLRWLAAQRLVRCDEGGSFDAVDVGAVFTLTTLGIALATSIAAIGSFVEQSPPPRSSRWVVRLTRPFRPFRNVR
jgi:hypothetical protein